MENSILLFCRHGEETNVMMISVHSQYENILVGIINRWNNLDVGCSCFSYSILGHSSYMLQNDVDLKNMFVLGREFRLSYIKISVSRKGNESHCSDGSELLQNVPFDLMDNNGYDTDDDLLPLFYHHTKRVLLSTGWSKEKTFKECTL